MLFVLKTTYLFMRRGLASTRQTRRHSPTCFARTRQTRQHLPKAILEKNVTRLDTFAQAMSKSRKFGVSGHCLIIIRFNKIDNFIWINLYWVFPLINFCLLLTCIYLLLILEKLIDRFPIKNDNPFFLLFGCPSHHSYLSVEQIDQRIHNNKFRFQFCVKQILKWKSIWFDECFSMSLVLSYDFDVDDSTVLIFCFYCNSFNYRHRDNFVMVTN